MDFLEDPNFKKKYQKSKCKVKLWERDFMDKYGRKPNKNDIRETDAAIRDAYKMYWKLKTKALEETLMDITFTDDVESNVSTNLLNTSDAENVIEKKDMPLSDISNIDNSNKLDSMTPTKVITKFEAESSTVGINPEGVWGTHLNKEKKVTPKKKQPLLVGRSSSFQLSQKMFKSTSFTKRNPRKSLSMVKSKSKSDLDGGALSNTRTPSQSEDGFDPNEILKPLLGEKMKVVQAENKIYAQPVSAVRQLIDSKPVNVNRKIDTGWLERCSGQNRIEPSSQINRLSGTSDSGVESLESSIHSPNAASFPAAESKTLEPFSEEEDFICNSDSEGERKNKRIRNKKSNLCTRDNPVAKRPCVEYCKATAMKEVLTKSSSEQEVSGTVLEIGEPKQPAKLNPKNDESKILARDEQVENKDAAPLHSEKLEKSLCNETEDSASEKKKKIGRVAPVRKTRQKACRKIKQNSQSDSDSKSRETAEEKDKKEVSKTRKTRATRGAKKPVAKTSKKKIDAAEAVEETEPDRPIYGVETVKAVPRFALPKLGSGDLVADFTQVISGTDTNKKEASSSGTKTKKKLTNKEIFEQKIASGNINDNFVRINLKKKVFVRGKKTINFQKYKKNQWKQRKKELASGDGGLDLADLVESKGVLTCFKCGDIGHFARECKSLKSDDLLPIVADEEPCEYPTLEEAAKMANENALAAHRHRLNLIPQTASHSLHSLVTEKENNQDDVAGDSEAEGTSPNDENLEDILDDLDFEEELEYADRESETLSGHEVPEHLLAKLLPPETGPVQPLYSKGSVTPDEVFEALKKFGHEKFRHGQEEAVMRILSGNSTLVTLSTGSGKSLCYQLPAYLYAKRSPCITLVISPLVSLMDDQVTGVPKFLSAASLHTAQPEKQRKKVMEKVKEGTLDILLISPEAVVAGEKSTGFGALLRQLPPIAFACIDEAHCISQWSHNFRPSYLMVCKVLREKLGVKTVLGLTATATKSTAKSIVDHLNIPDGMDGVISDTPLPRNLTLTVSKDEQRDRALIALLDSERFKELNSIIVYCTRRDECVRIAGLLRMSLNNSKVQSTTDEKVSPIAEAYHAGLSSHRRKTVQNAFMSGATKIVVATVAFGMGINKPDIRAVIHFNMPSSFESYVQEVGRSGRDGLPAHCHLFISSQGTGDKSELRRHIYANGVDRHMIRRLLQKVFVPCSCSIKGTENHKSNRRCPGHEVAIPVDEIVKLLDIPQEIISTLLCYLELHPRKFITNLPSVYVNAKVTSYNGPKALQAAAQSSPPLAMAIALDIKRGISHENSSIIEFPVVTVAAAIGWDSGVVKGHLKELEWKTTDTGAWKRTPISVSFDTLGFRVRAPGDLSDTELDDALDILTERASSQQHMGLCQLEKIHTALTEVVLDSVRQCRELTEDIMNKSESLKVTIREYFQSENPMEKVDLKLEAKLPNEAQIAGDVRSLVYSYRDCNFTGRAVARIFHGIQSPNYPALVWSRCRFWRSHLSSNFELICQVATREILAMR